MTRSESTGDTTETGISQVDVVKWVATIVQLCGYGLTGLNIVPRNIYAFFVGIVLWFAMGVMRKDKAIMVVHVGALLLGFLIVRFTIVKQTIG